MNYDVMLHLLALSCAEATCCCVCECLLQNSVKINPMHVHSNYRFKALVFQLEQKCRFELHKYRFLVRYLVDM